MVKLDAQDVTGLTIKRFWRSENKTKRFIVVISFCYSKLNVGDIVGLCVPDMVEPIKMIVFETGEINRCIVKGVQDGQ